MKKYLALFVSAVLVIGLTIGLGYGRSNVSASVPGTNQMVSINSGGTNGGNDLTNNSAISADGKYVVFASSASNLVSGDTNNAQDIFVRNLSAGTTARVDVSTAGVQANSSAINGYGGPGISKTGRYIVFASNATNLIDGQ